MAGILIEILLGLALIWGLLLGGDQLLRIVSKDWRAYRQRQATGNDSTPPTPSEPQ